MAVALDKGRLHGWWPKLTPHQDTHVVGLRRGRLEMRLEQRLDVRGHLRQRMVLRNTIARAQFIENRTVQHVFELILRLRGNYLWPAMWRTAFFDDDPLNGKL